MNFQRLTEGHQTTRMLLLGIIFLTVPCYCLGAVLLAYAPEEESTPAPGITRSPLGQQTASARPSITPFFTATYTSTSALQPTPGQVQLRTSVPTFFFPTAILTMTPTNTTIPSPTDAPSPTVPPSPTLPPSETSVPPTEDDVDVIEATPMSDAPGPPTAASDLDFEVSPTQESF